MKSFKNLFIKDDQPDEREPNETNSFPVSESTAQRSHSSSPNPFLDEITEVYKKGLESINMPGYDFYDFYLAIVAAGSQNEAIYKMAFQMGKTLDNNVSPQKLTTDAEYYISKLNDVYQNYAEKGRQKLNNLAAELKTEKDSLNSEIHHIESEINRLKQQIHSMEQKLVEAKNTLNKVEDKYKPQQDVINQKLQANDQAMKISVKQLTSIKEGILRYIK